MVRKKRVHFIVAKQDLLTKLIAKFFENPCLNNTAIARPMIRDF